MEGTSHQSEPVSPLGWYQLFRSRIEHEDKLILQRLSWLVASQSFLFTAYAVTTNGLSNPAARQPSVFLRQQVLLFHLIPLVAICNALLILIGILAALRAVGELRRAYETKKRPFDGPPLQTSARTRRLGVSAPVLLPLLFIAVWLLLLLYGLG